MNGSQNGLEWYDYQHWRRQVVGQDVNVARVVQLNHRWILFSLLEGHYRASRSLENHLVASFARCVELGIRLRERARRDDSSCYARVTAVTARGLFKVAAIAAPIMQIIVHTADRIVATTPHARLKTRAEQPRYKKKPMDD